VTAISDRAAELLSPKQINTMLSDGNRLITACPGAGKTRSTGARAALLDERSLNVSLATYTNVAADEMRTALMRDYGVALGDRHFLGTLHQFFLRFVFRPFSHLVYGLPRATERPS